MMGSDRTPPTRFLLGWVYAEDDESKSDAAVRELRSIVDGIDRDETEDDDGWWETSTGAEFGAERLRHLERLIERLASP